MDAQIARLRAYLDQHDLTRRTVIVVIGDHGEGLGDHGELTHGLFVYQSVLRVPFVIRAPRLEAGRRVTGAVSSADLLPTVLELLDVPAPDGVDGRSLVRTLRRPERENVPAIYAENLYVQRFNWSEMRAIREGSLKLIDKTRPELYDLARDPGETRDLSAEQPSVAARMAEHLRAWHTSLAAEADPGGRAPTVGATDARALSSLGYVSEAVRPSSPTSGPSTPDPRDHVATFNCMMARLVASRPPGVPPDSNACREPTLPPHSGHP
jgi:arylsulfatase A-like enzyme